MRKLRLTHQLHDFIECYYQEQCLFRYIYESQTAQAESPRPYFHPLNTLAGNEVTLFRPYDHLWHIGLSFTAPNLSGQNFWGGPSYVRGPGYIGLENHGRMQHTNWQELSCDEIVRCVEHLQWITQDDRRWIEEERKIVVREIDPVEQYWSLELSFDLLNVTTHPLIFGSPTTEGRPAAGYGSLFWRGPRSFLHGKILAADGLEGSEIMGKTSPWLAFSGRHDGNAQASTLLFFDYPDNPRFPTRWFVRNDPYACLSCSFMFDEEYALRPDEKLILNYRVVIANGEWSRSRIEEYARQAEKDKKQRNQ